MKALFPSALHRTPPVTNTSCLPFTVDLTWIPLGHSTKQVFNTSSAAGWKRSGVSGASPLPDAPCCASHSPVSLEIHGSAVKEVRQEYHPSGSVASEAQQPIRFAKSLLDMQSKNCLFKKGDLFVYLVKSSCQKYPNLLHPVGGGKGPAARTQVSYRSAPTNF